jgi:hypothetical protein
VIDPGLRKIGKIILKLTMTRYGYDLCIVEVDVWERQSRCTHQ